jgi:hypothetical protein
MLRNDSRLARSASRRPCSQSRSSGSSHWASAGHEHPLPAVQAPDAFEPEDEAGNRRADYGGDGNGEHEEADDAGAVGGGKPERQEEDDAGEEARFRHAEQRAHDIETEFSRDEGLRAGNQSPGEHDARDPAAGAETVEQEVAGNLKEKIGDEEYAGRSAKGGGGEIQILAHRRAGESDIDAIDVSDEIAKDQERHETPCDLAHCSLFHDACRLSRHVSSNFILYLRRDG